ncbi:MAG: Stp1/IreP family PP2C-type Ser/Thr phosphatase [Chlamydiota bacterium]
MNQTPFTLTAHGSSDIGLVRLNNEDVWSTLKEHGFFILADGMGGHNAGEIAAKEAVQAACLSVKKFFTSAAKPLTPLAISSASKASIEAANRWVYRLGKEKKDYKGMGTTLCTLLFHDQSLIYGHVGDSRIYRLRNFKLDQLTADHSLKNALISQGKITAHSSKPFPYKNVLTKAVGTHPHVEPDIQITPVNRDDVYLMCSDGLTDYVDHQKIHRVLAQDRNPKSAIQTLIQLAKKHGGNDNITIVIVRVDEAQKHHLPR